MSDWYEHTGPCWTVIVVAEARGVPWMEEEEEGDWDTMAKKMTSFYEEEDEEDLVSRPPVVTIMGEAPGTGHFDHKCCPGYGQSDQLPSGPIHSHSSCYLVTLTIHTHHFMAILTKRCG